jgi:hypothetical protein
LSITLSEAGPASPSLKCAESTTFPFWISAMTFPGAWPTTWVSGFIAPGGGLRPSSMVVMRNFVTL